MSLLDRFQQTQEGLICEKFLALRQKGTVREYQQMYEALTAPLDNVSDFVLEGAFINGLRPDILADVRMLASRGGSGGKEGLREIMVMAQRVED